MGPPLSPARPVPAEAFADRELREQWIREKGLAVFALWSADHPTLEVDLFVSEPFDFEAVYARAIRVALEQTEATLNGLGDVIAMKRQAGRPRDQEGIAALASLQGPQETPTRGDDG